MTSTTDITRLMDMIGETRRNLKDITKDFLQIVRNLDNIVRESIFIAAQARIKTATIEKIGLENEQEMIKSITNKIFDTAKLWINRVEAKALIDMEKLINEIDASLRDLSNNLFLVLLELEKR